MYTLNESDIEAYLATKQDTDVVGVVVHGSQCLLAQAALWKYPDTKPCVYGGGLHIGDEDFELPEPLLHLYYLFDTMESWFDRDQMERSVTKQEWLAFLARKEVG